MQKSRHIATLISRCLAKKKLPEVKKRVEELNNLHFKKEIKKSDFLIMTAAVSDFRAKKIPREKIKRKSKLSITFLPNKDILAELSKYKSRKLFIGFNLETSNLVKNARLKLKAKNLDIIVANRLTKHHNPFGNNKLDICLIDKKGDITKIKNVWVKNQRKIYKIFKIKSEKWQCKILNKILISLVFNFSF